MINFVTLSTLPVNKKANAVVNPYRSTKTAIYKWVTDKGKIKKIKNKKAFKKLDDMFTIYAKSGKVQEDLSTKKQKHH